VVVWSYPRGSSLSKEGETAIDVAAYAAQIACQLGAHIIKVKPPTAHIEQAEAKKVYEKEKIPVATLAERTRHVVQSAFGGRRIVIFSGGPAKGRKEIIDEIRGLADGGSFGSIMGGTLPAAAHGGDRAPARGDGHLHVRLTERAPPRTSARGPMSAAHAPPSLLRLAARFCLRVSCFELQEQSCPIHSGSRWSISTPRSLRASSPRSS
jgi:hypothetical protein